MKKICGISLLLLLFIGRDILINQYQKVEARIDVFEMTSSGQPCFDIKDASTNGSFPVAEWMAKFGQQGYVIQNQNSEENLNISSRSDNCIVNFTLRGPWALKDKSDSKKGLKELWVEYTKFAINGQDIITKSTPAWHNKPFRYKTTLDKGQSLNVAIKWADNTNYFYYVFGYILMLIGILIYFQREIKDIFIKIKQLNFRDYIKNKFFWLNFILFGYLEVTYLLDLISVDEQITILQVFLSLILNIMLAIVSFKTAGYVIDRKPYVITNTNAGLMAAFAGLALLCLLLIYHLAYWPGIWVYDVIKHNLPQGLGLHSYNNWHPVWHTFLFFTIPSKIFSNAIEFMLVQHLWLSLAFAYLVYTLYANKIVIGARFYIFYILVNSVFLLGMEDMTKDRGLSIFSMILFAQYINIILSQGKWLCHKFNLVLFAIVLVSTNYMRHNAILFTLPILLITLFYLKNKKITQYALLGGVVVMVIFIKLLYAHLNVAKPVGRVIETILFPMTIVSNVMKQSPEKLPLQTQHELYKWADKSVYETFYVPGNVNSIKWNPKYKERAFDEAEFSKMTRGRAIRYLYESFRYAPKPSFEAFAKLTNIVWSMNLEIKNPVYILDNPFGLKQNYQPSYQRITDILSRLESCKYIKLMFGSVGVFTFFLFVFALALIYRSRISFIHAIPLLAYNFGTMCFLAGPGHRFFLLNIPLWLPTIYLMLADRKK